MKEDARRILLCHLSPDVHLPRHRALLQLLRQSGVFLWCHNPKLSAACCLLHSFLLRLWAAGAECSWLASCQPQHPIMQACHFETLIMIGLQVICMPNPTCSTVLVTIWQFQLQCKHVVVLEMPCMWHCQPVIRSRTVTLIV